MRNEGAAGQSGHGRADALVASVRESLGEAEIALLLQDPAPAEPVWHQVRPDMADAVRRLMDLEVVDPAGLVSVRVQLVDAGPGGVRLTRLGRMVAAALRAER